MKVQNMTSAKGNKVANQFIITEGSMRIFQSYDTTIAKVVGKAITLDKDSYNYSRTTIKYRNMFLGMTSKEVEANIKNGTIVLDNLNS